ncbi:unnamed protein product, partial [Ectocarpus sp. 12 AP-2014]
VEESHEAAGLNPASLFALARHRDLHVVPSWQDFVEFHVLHDRVCDFSWLWNALLLDVGRSTFLPYFVRPPGWDAWVLAYRHALGGEARRIPVEVRDGVGLVPIAAQHDLVARRPVSAELLFGWAAAAADTASNELFLPGLPAPVDSAQDDAEVQVRARERQNAATIDHGRARNGNGTSAGAETDADSSPANAEVRADHRPTSSLPSSSPSPSSCEDMAYTHEDDAGEVEARAPSRQNAPTIDHCRAGNGTSAGPETDADSSPANAEVRPHDRPPSSPPSPPSCQDMACTHEVEGSGDQPLRDIASETRRAPGGAPGPGETRDGAEDDDRDGQAHSQGDTPGYDG